MFNATQRPAGGKTNLSQILSHEARLNRLHRLFKTHFNVTEPSLVLEPYLFLGNCISAQDIHRLHRLGIRYVLNVAKRDVELCPYYSKDMRTLTIDLRDDDRENILRTFDQAFAFIDEARRTNSRVLVHCSHGQSRSPAIVIGYLMRTYNTSLEQCLVHVVRARPCVIPNDGFLKQLILYDRFLFERHRQQQQLQHQQLQQQQQQQQAAVVQGFNSQTSTEIQIQHHSTVIPQDMKPFAPTILTLPMQPIIPIPNATNLSSINSSNRGLSSIASVPSSISTNSVKVIPIQISPTESDTNKIDLIPIEKIPTENKINAEDTNKKVRKSEEKSARRKSSKASIKTPLQGSSSHSGLVLPKKPIVKRTKNDQPIPPSVPRSNTSIFYPSNVTRHNDSSPRLTPDQWKFINSYSSVHAQRDSIIEIYDRATNRFIPTTLYY